MAPRLVVSRLSGHVHDLLHGLDQPGQDLVAQLLLRADVQVDGPRAGLDLFHGRFLEELRVAVGDRLFDLGDRMWMFSPMIFMADPPLIALSQS